MPPRNLPKSKRKHTQKDKQSTKAELETKKNQESVKDVSEQDEEKEVGNSKKQEILLDKESKGKEMKENKQINEDQYLCTLTNRHGEQVRIIALSDTHNMHDCLEIDQLPQADIFIHAGDFTISCQQHQLSDFRHFLEKLPHQHKIVIPGNHEAPLQPDSKRPMPRLERQTQIQAFKEVCQYVECQVIEAKGLKILAMSNGPDYFDWYHDYAPQQGAAFLNEHKGNIDILVTHFPPLGILDRSGKEQTGSRGLLSFVEQLSPQLHIFGHIHEAQGKLQRGDCLFCMYGSDLMYVEGKNQEVEVTIRNLPNEAAPEDILNYLEMTGPIKSHKFIREDERFSAIVVYHDSESAEICKRELGDRYYKGRALTITTEAKKSHQLTPVSPDEELIRQIGALRREERQVLLGLLRNIRGEGKIFQAFLESRPKVTEALLRGE